MNDPIEDALLSYPLAEVPHGFSRGVMKQIRARSPLPKFRLSWLDYALGLFLCSLPVVGFVIRASLPRLLVMRMEYQWLRLSSPAIEPLVLGTVGILVMALGLGLIVGLRFTLKPKRFGM